MLSSEGGILSVTTIVQAFTLRPMERSYGAQPCQAKRPGGPRSSMFQQKFVLSHILVFLNKYLSFFTYNYVPTRKIPHARTFLQRSFFPWSCMFDK